MVQGTSVFLLIASFESLSFNTPLLALSGPHQHWPSFEGQFYGCSSQILYTCFSVIFCFATVNRKITHLWARVTHFTGSLPPTLIKGAKKGELDAFFLFFCDTFQMLCIFTFVAADPLRTTNSIFVDHPITDVPQSEAHLVWCLSRAYKALSLEHIHTFGMLTLVWVLGKLHAKKKTSSR